VEGAWYGRGCGIKAATNFFSKFSNFQFFFFQFLIILRCGPTLRTRRRGVVAAAAADFFSKFQNFHFFFFNLQFLIILLYGGAAAHIAEAEIYNIFSSLFFHFNNTACLYPSWFFSWFMIIVIIRFSLIFKKEILAPMATYA
jgi:hypothetical protein